MASGVIIFYKFYNTIKKTLLKAGHLHDIGYEIPYKAQILNVADVYNALTTDRPYRKGFNEDRAFEIMAQMPLNQELVNILRTHYKK